MKPIAKGKTKELFAEIVTVQAKDIVTWGNTHQAPMSGKAEWSTETTCNVFRLLQKHKIPVAFIERTGPDTFLAPYCDMIPLEIVGRSVIDPKSSFLKRNPGYPPEMIGVPLEIPEVEFFLKTKGPVFEGIEVPDDDPLIVDPLMGGVGERGFSVIHPAGKEGHAFIPAEVFGYPGNLPKLFDALRIMMGNLTITLRDAWARIGWTLGDLKGECGFTRDGRLLWADVFDNDSWRLRDSLGIERSKQVVRDHFAALFRPEMSAEDINALYAYVMEEASRDFRVVAFASKLLPDSYPQL
ncbi:MAG: phosphoribosylaminoimidazolesuccinocarboxamide synthase [bacterium]|nr:phosphoribosylaminoimidazolesuccinocarboxamide synthase [bacterium]